MFDGKDLVGQACGLNGGEGEGVKCVWEEETGLEFVAEEVCAHLLNIKFNFTFMRCLGTIMSLPKIKKTHFIRQCLSGHEY